MVSKNNVLTSILFVQYPKCSTCRKAKKWLDEHNIDYQSKHIVEDNPTADELREWWEISDLPLKRFFNTSGMKYRELKLKDKLPEMSEDEQLNILATDGMLVKRPIIVDDDDLQVGYNTDDISIFLPQELRSLDCDICESSDIEIKFDENLKEELKKIKD